MKIRVRIEPENVMGLWACEVGSASADFTPQNENLPKPAAARDWLVEVGTETADFNVLLLPKPSSTTLRLRLMSRRSPPTNDLPGSSFTLDQGLTISPRTASDCRRNWSKLKLELQCNSPDVTRTSTPAPPLSGCVSSLL